MYIFSGLLENYLHENTNHTLACYTTGEIIFKAGDNPIVVNSRFLNRQCVITTEFLVIFKLER